MGLFSSKKGLDYAVLLVVVVFISIGALYGQVSNQQISGKELGDVQVPLLLSNSEARLFEVYLRESAKLSVVETAQSLRYSTPQSCILLNSEEDAEKVSSVLPVIETKFVESFDRHLARYESEKNKRSPGWHIPQGAVSLAVSDSEVIGVFEKSVRIPLIDPVGREMGSIEWRPAFEVQSTVFNSFSSAFREVEGIARQCSRALNVSECVSSKTSLRVDSQGEVFRFISSTDEFCLSLHFPVIA